MGSHFKPTSVTILSLLTLLLYSTCSFAQNKVVVVPLQGNDTALAQQHFKYTERVENIVTASVPMCETNEFATPDQSTQVVINGSVSALKTSTSGYIWGEVEYLKDDGSWTNISNNFSGLASGTNWTTSTVFETLDLEPDSNYTFRLMLQKSSTAFVSSVSYYCQNLLTFSYQLPEGESIVEIVLPE